MEPAFSSRLAGVRAALAGLRADAFLTLEPQNFYYLCGFSGSSGALLVERRSATLHTDGRYAIQAAEQVRGAKVRIVRKGLVAALAETVRARRIRTLAVEGAHLSLAVHEALRKALGRHTRLVPATDVVEALRTVKDAQELSLLRDAARLGSAIFEQVLPLLRPGVQEQEIATEMDYRMRRAGASGSAFETIVAFGERTALPHARPTDRRLRKNELVMLDWGAILRGYCCDLTRTVFVGRAPRNVRKLYDAVRGAQQAACQAIRPGARAEAVDQAARAVLQRVGLVRFFAHSTGHGLGLDVHELPRLARGQKAQLLPGQVVTVEPGVYVEGLGGVRIEDDVAVTPSGYEILTTPARDLVEL